MADTGGGSERGAVERDGSAAPRPNPRELFAQRRAATMSSLPSQFSSAKPGGNGLRLGDEAIYPEVSALNLRSQSRTLQRRRSTSVYSTNPHDILTSRVVLAMVGLPARGKSYLSKAIFRYLNFLGCPTKLFNAGNLRRQAGLAGTDAAFFDATNASAVSTREQLAMECLEQLLGWISTKSAAGGGCVCGIFDATNTTVERRAKVIQRVAQETNPVQLVFLESICNDETTLHNNYRMKLRNEDYKGADPQQAIADFLTRVAQYEKVYQSVTEAEEDVANFGPLRYVKMVNAGKKLEVSNCEGYVPQRLLGLLHSIHLGPRAIWIVLTGETTNDRIGVLGGDSPLSEAGLEYSRAVSEVKKKTSHTPVCC